MESSWLDVCTAPCCFRTNTPQLLQSLLEIVTPSGVQVPPTLRLSVNLCPLASLDASVRVSRAQGDGEMGVWKEEPPSAKQGKGTGFML